MMLHHEVHALPVLQEGVLWGIITSSDILSGVASGKLDP
jgi:CBS domain-containing protein